MLWKMLCIDETQTSGFGAWWNMLGGIGFDVFSVFLNNSGNCWEIQKNGTTKKLTTHHFL